MNTNIYQKPEPARFSLEELLGPGVLVVEGEKHKQQARAIAHSTLEYLTDPAI